MPDASSRFTPEQTALFWSRVAPPDVNGCRLWTVGTTKAGYGQFQMRKVSPAPLLAHRVAWELTFGPVPDGRHVLHECDTPRCCTPGHLFLGDQRDNNDDRDRKHRTASGERNGARTHPERNPFVRNGGAGLRGARHPGAKLTAAQVAAIRAAYDSGEARKCDLARAYGMSQTQIGRIVRRTTYKE